MAPDVETRRIMRALVDANVSGATGAWTAVSSLASSVVQRRSGSPVRSIGSPSPTRSRTHRHLSLSGSVQSRDNRGEGPIKAVTPRDCGAVVNASRQRTPVTSRGRHAGTCGVGGRARDGDQESLSDDETAVVGANPRRVCRRGFSSGQHVCSPVLGTVIYTPARSTSPVAFGTSSFRNATQELSLSPAAPRSRLSQSQFSDRSKIENKVEVIYWGREPTEKGHHKQLRSCHGKDGIQRTQIEGKGLTVRDVNRQTCTVACDMMNRGVENEQISPDYGVKLSHSPRIVRRCDLLSRPTVGLPKTTEFGSLPPTSAPMPTLTQPIVSEVEPLREFQSSCALTSLSTTNKPYFSRMAFSSPGKEMVQVYPGESNGEQISGPALGLRPLSQAENALSETAQGLKRTVECTELSLVSPSTCCSLHLNLSSSVSAPNSSETPRSDLGDTVAQETTRGFRELAPVGLPEPAFSTRQVTSPSTARSNASVASPLADEYSVCDIVKRPFGGKEEDKGSGCEPRVVASRGSIALVARAAEFSAISTFDRRVGQEIVDLADVATTSVASHAEVSLGGRRRPTASPSLSPRTPSFGVDAEKTLKRTVSLFFDKGTVAHACDSEGVGSQDRAKPFNVLNNDLLSHEEVTDPTSLLTQIRNDLDKNTSLIRLVASEAQNRKAALRRL
eukprot:TRINITY_DN25664_c0_g1_i1.p1 TRINITY_DN25664_c0_g1~~TRINITY_DN25664_c0_g1_i1.p1  ORF type:complete len:787 (+),score=102.00 TRINITY_DN25664_c0_g1_i1:341-2362(+)